MVKDLTGNALQTDRNIWTFSTGLTIRMVTFTDPTNNVTNVPLNKLVLNQYANEGVNYY
jgi:hypothetical protein